MMRSVLDRGLRAAALALLALGLAFVAPASGAGSRKATIYKDPNCGCCAQYAAYLRRAGFEVTLIDTERIDALKRLAGVADELASCHTASIDGYVVEGHVPLAVIDRLLEERPAIRGVALPGMPAGAPGMNGVKTEPFAIYTIADGPARLYATD